MQSECTATSPQFISSYAWKLPPARQAIFERASKLILGAGENSDASEAEHPSIPWKAYLASREFQHLASDLAEAIFSTPPRLGLESATRPACLRLDARALPENEGEPRRGLLAAALPQGGASAQDDAPSKVARDILIAA